MRKLVFIMMALSVSAGLWAQVKVAKPEDHGMDPERLARVDAVIDDAIRGDLFNPETTLMHTGYTGTSLVIDLDTQTAIVLLTNRVHPTDDGSVSRLRALVSNIVAGAILY
jgi:CubicO group peptidase (beta-lactamase class C family)